MIQACESVELLCAPLSSPESTATSAIDTTTTTLSATTTTTSSADGFSNEAESSACGGGQGPTAQSQHPASSFDASSTNLESQYPPDVKSGFDELCPVCGDKVSGYHYGLLTCESCKGFFKRTVQNKKVYSCVDSRQCPIDKSQRKRCPYCRFQKCLNVGMKLEAVRQDRMRGGRNKFGPMYKRDRAMKQQQIRSQQHIMAECKANMQGAGGAPGSPPDIKPDPAMLQASLGLGFSPSNLGNHADISSMAAAMAAAVVGASSIDGMRDGRDGMLPNTTTSGGSYSNLSHSASSGGGRGLPGGGVHSGDGGSPLHLDDGTTGALNLHTPQHSQHNGLHHHSNHGRSSHLPPPPPHTQPHPQPHPSSLENPYLLQTHPTSGFSAQPPSENGTPPGTTTLDTLRGYGVPPLPIERPTLPPLLCEIKANLLDEEEMKQKMLSFLTDTLRQMDGISHTEQLLPIVCGMVDQLLFLMVEWARSSPFFKEIRVEDQMKLLQSSWSEILILDFVYRQVQEHWGTELLLQNGLRLSFDTLDKLGLGDVRVRLFELIKKSRELKLDYNEYMCLKFLILLNPDTAALENRQYVEQSQEKVNAALLEYCLSFYPNLKDKFGQILMRLPEIRIISIRVEEFLYYKHINNQVPDQTLLTEMLHSRRK